MRNSIIILSSFFFFLVSFSQEPNDCINAITVCGNGNFVSNVNGPGNEPNEISGCGAVFENNVFWIKIDVVQAGTLGFDLIPVSTDMQVDYDFWVFGPNVDCDNLGSAIRCNTNNPLAEGASNNHTGINGSTTSTIAGPGSVGTPYVQWLNVQPGQSYYIAIDRFLGDEGFELQWTGTATQGSGAFAEPPLANEIPDYLTCSNNPNVGLFDLNTVRSDINPDTVNNTFTFYNTYADAIDGVNALPNLLTNSSNPQTVIAKVTNNVTGCFSLTEFDLVVSGIPVVNMSVSETSLCSGENVTITFNGTPGVTVNYEINGVPQQAVLDSSGTFSFVDVPLIDTDYQLINAQVVNSVGEVICSNAGIGDTQSVAVNSMQMPVVTSNSPICQGSSAEIIFSGEAGIVIDFLLDGSPNSITLAADGTYQVTIPNVSNNIEVELQNMEQAVAPFCTQDLMGNDLTIIVNPLPLYEEPVPKILCDFNNPGDEQELFLLDAAEILVGENGVTYTFYESYNNAVNDIDALEGDPNNPNNEISYYNQTNPQILYIRGENDATGCFTIMTLDLEVLPIPEANTPTDLNQCDEAPNDGFAIFDLTEVEPEILGGQDPNNYEITYYLSQAEAELPASAITNPENYENSLVNGETIYTRIEIVGDSQCYTITSFNIEVLPLSDASFQMNATCDGATATVTGDSGTFAFNPVPTDGAVIDTNSGTITNATPGAVYTVEYTTNGTCSTSSMQNVTVHGAVNVVAPTPLEVCDDNVPDGFTAIDLTIKNTEISGNSPNYTVSYYFSQTDANTGNNPLPNPYTNVSNPQTVYVRVVDTTTGCYGTTTLQLDVQQAPMANIPTPLEFCDPDNDGFGSFDLDSKINEITGGDTSLSVTFHGTLSNAENNINALVSPYSNVNAYTQTVFVRVESATIATQCETIVELDLVVLDTPQIEENPGDLEICDTDQDGFASFDFADHNVAIFGSQNPANFQVSYHASQTDADLGNNPIANTSAYTNTINPQPIFVRVENLNNTCYSLSQFNLVVNLPPVLTAPTDLELCEDSVVDGFTVFDLTVKNDEIRGGNSSWTVRYFESNADAQANTGAITNASTYTNTSNPQTLFVRVTNPEGCYEFTTLTLRVLDNPSPNPNPQDILVCDVTNTGDEQETVDLTQYETQTLNGEANVAATYYLDAYEADQELNPILDPTNFQNTTNPQTIYVRATNTVSGCYTIVDFDVLVNPLPQATTVSDMILCEVNTDGFGQFDLNSKNQEVLNGQDSLVYQVSYHDNQADADTGNMPLTSPYTNTINPQTIFVRIANVNTGCSISTTTFNIEVQEGATATAPAQDYVVCDDAGDNDGIAEFDLSTQDTEILNGQDPVDYSVSYYESMQDAENASNPLPIIYQNTTSPQIIYVRVDNINTSCFDIAQLTLRVELLPEFDIEGSYVICTNTNGTEVVQTPPVIDTGLNASDYSFEWVETTNPATVLGTGSSFQPSVAGSYMVTVTTNASGCEASAITTVEESSPPTITATVTTQAFSSNQVIEVNVIETGDFEFSLDNGSWQNNGTNTMVFTNVSVGEHLVTVKDVYGCGEVSEMVTVIGYPQYFTPNGDGYHDTWNIVGFANQPDTQIFIFDRFGKLLKQLSPSGTGWDGTFNGEPVPSNDYWFKVEYTDLNSTSNVRKEFTSHFTLKR